MRRITCFVLSVFLVIACLSVIPDGFRFVSAADAKPTVYICGDSTVQTYRESYAPQQGWGQNIQKYFTGDVLFVNKAIAGRSSKSFIADGRLDEIINVIKPNDYLFVQFGHNDASFDKPERYTEPNTTYKEYLRQYIDKARSKSAIPVLITPVARLNYSNKVFKNDFPAYCNAMKEVAKEKNVPCIDLMSLSINYYTSIGYDRVYPFYMVSSNGTDYTHFTDKGATEIARLVAEGVKGLNLAISKYVINTSSAGPTGTPVNTPTDRPTVTAVNTPTKKPSPTNTQVVLSEDINGDNAVNISDIMMIAAYFNTITTDNSLKCDLNRDGAINIGDVMIVVLKFNTIITQ
jgi:lysophospholipase L1-like esterase